MGKINVANISAGLKEVQSITQGLSNISKNEILDIADIYVADYNPAAKHDTDESRYNLAMSIKANGLIEPLAVNRIGENKYKLISGECRLTAIRQYIPEMKKVSCMVYSNLSEDEAQIKVYEANRYREYSSEQKLIFYTDLRERYARLSESGKFSGSIQKAIAECLGVSDHQMRKYKAIADNLTPEHRQAVATGAVSIDAAYQQAVVAKRMQSAEEIDKSEAAPADEEPAAPATESEPQGRASDLSVPLIGGHDEAWWNKRMKEAIKHHYIAKDLHAFYTQQVPTTQEAIKGMLKPQYGGGGGTIKFADGTYGFANWNMSYAELEYKRCHNPTFTYSKIDALVREMIRAGELL